MVSTTNLLRQARRLAHPTWMRISKEVQALKITQPSSIVSIKEVALLLVPILEKSDLDEKNMIVSYDPDLDMVEFEYNYIRSNRQLIVTINQKEIKLYVYGDHRPKTSLVFINSELGRFDFSTALLKNIEQWF